MEKDKVITDLLERIANLEFEVEKKEKIINELERYCNEEIEDYDKNINSKFITNIAREQYEGEKVCFEDMLDRLQELKGSNNGIWVNGLLEVIKENDIEFGSDKE